MLGNQRLSVGPGPAAIANPYFARAYVGRTRKLRANRSAELQMKILRSRPKFGIVVDIVRNIGNGTAHAAHPVEADSALCDIFLNTVESEPKAVPVICGTTGHVERERIDRGICAEPDIASSRRKFQGLILVERNACPLVRSLDQSFRSDEEVFRENVGSLLGRAIVQERLSHKLTRRSHQAVGADHAEHAEQERHAAGAVVGVDETDLGNDRAEVRALRAVILVAEGHKVLRVLGRRLARVDLPSVHDEPATVIERVQVVLGAHELVTLAPRFVRRVSEEGGDGGLEIGEVAHDGVDSRFCFCKFKRES